MKIEKTFIIPIDEAVARQRLNTYFDQAGYRSEPEGESHLVFKRGSRRGSWLAINPSRFQTRVDVQLKPKGNQIQVRAEFEVKTIMRDDTHFAQEFWTGEVKELEAALREGKYSPLRSKWLTLKALLAIFKSLVNPFVYILIWGALSLGITFVVMRLPGSASAVPEIVALVAMIVSGIITYILSRFWKRWQARKYRNSETDEWRD